MNKESKLDIVAKWAQIVTSVCLLIIAFITIRINSTAFRYEFRPYVGILDFKVTNFSEKNVTIEVTVNNVGKLPANNVKSKIDKTAPGLAEKSTFKQDESAPSIILPNGTALFPVTIDGITPEIFKAIQDGKLKFQIHLIYSYDGIYERGYSTEYIINFNPERKAFELIGGKAT